MDPKSPTTVQQTPTTAPLAPPLAPQNAYKFNQSIQTQIQLLSALSNTHNTLKTLPALLNSLQLFTSPVSKDGLLLLLTSAKHTVQQQAEE